MKPSKNRLSNQCPCVFEISDAELDDGGTPQVIRTDAEQDDIRGVVPSFEGGLILLQKYTSERSIDELKEGV